MARRDYVADSKNPFFSTLDDDVDDDTFLNHPQSGRGGYMLPNQLSREQQNLEDRKMQLLENKRQIEQRTLQSAQRSLGLLHESEQVGISTAEDLVTQREQLERTEQRLDDINSNLRISQKHIQSIKSVFGSMKNYFSSGKTPPPPSTNTAQPRSVDSTQTSRASSALTKAVDSTKNEFTKGTSHPGLRTRGVFDDDGDSYTSSGKQKSVDEQLDNNLSDMANSLSRLKGLARGLETEIDEQNELLDRVQSKADGVDIRIQRQNKDMRHILKK